MNIRILFAFSFTSIAIVSSRSQGFINLNFESARVSGYPPNDSAVPISAALPGWSASLSNSSTGTMNLSQVWYDTISGAGPVVAINDSNTGNGFASLQGTFSAMLFGGESDVSPSISATISQTGLVPVGTESLKLEAGTIPGTPLVPFVVTLGGQTISMVPLQAYSSYSVYGGDISHFAGQVETLSITEPAPQGLGPSQVILDDIQFSTSAVPEPASYVLILAGVATFRINKWRNRLNP